MPEFGMPARGNVFVGNEVRDAQAPSPAMPRQHGEGLRVDEIDMLLSRRGEFAFRAGVLAGEDRERRLSVATLERQRVVHEQEIENVRKGLGTAAAASALAASAPVADAIGKARKAVEALVGVSGVEKRAPAKVREARAALTDLADAYAKFTAELGE
jgi:hypothetical protein